MSRRHLVGAVLAGGAAIILIAALIRSRGSADVRPPATESISPSQIGSSSSGGGSGDTSAASSRNRSASAAPEVSATGTLVPQLVGKQVCGECHKENFHWHGQSGHASTFAATADSSAAQQMVGQTFDGGESFGTYHYETDASGTLVARMPDRFQGDSFPIQFAIGSGSHATTFFSLIPDAAGGTVGLEHRATWFGAEQELGLTPGHDDKVPTDEVEYFGFLTKGKDMHACVECHTTAGKIEGQQVVGLVANVNCEKCHGPGSEHVRQARSMETPPPYSVGRSDWDAETELELCGSCHRMPEDMSDKQTRDYPNAVARFQPVGMLRSACYLESGGMLRCTTCHDPHRPSQSTSRDAYVQHCIDCHQPEVSDHVTCPESTTEGCIECHMPALKFVRGIRFHDHWIRVRDDQ